MDGDRWTIARRIMLWAVPGVLVAVLAWSLLPRGRSPVDASRPPLAGTQDGGGSGKAGTGASGETAGPSTSARESAPRSPTPYGEIRLGDLVGTDDAGHKRWRIVADEVTLAQGTQVVLLRGVRGTFFAPDGATLSVTGNLGRYDTGTRDVDLEGDVHGVSSAGRELFADKLHYSSATNEITGTGHVRLIEERVIMNADRMVSSTTLGQTRFFGHIHITAR